MGAAALGVEVVPLGTDGKLCSPVSGSVDVITHSVVHELAVAFPILTTVPGPAYVYGIESKADPSICVIVKVSAVGVVATTPVPLTSSLTLG
jgi:hypothetical protein